MTTSRWVLVCSLALAMPTGAGLLRVWVHQDLVRLGYQLSGEEKERARLEDLVRQLEIERAAERSPEQLLQWAAKLGLLPPNSHQIWKQGVILPQKRIGHGKH